MESEIRLSKALISLCFLVLARCIGCGGDKCCDIFCEATENFIFSSPNTLWREASHMKNEGSFKL